MSEPAAMPMSLEEFLDWAERQEIPYELVDGRPVPKHPDDDMGADTVDHRCIQADVGAILKTQKPPAIARGSVRASRSARPATASPTWP
jgi:hypothetical protein